MKKQKTMEDEPLSVAKDLIDGSSLEHHQMLIGTGEYNCDDDDPEDDDQSQQMDDGDQFSDCDEGGPDSGADSEDIQEEVKEQQKVKEVPEIKVNQQITIKETVEVKEEKKQMPDLQEAIKSQPQVINNDHLKFLKQLGVSNNNDGTLRTKYSRKKSRGASNFTSKRKK